MWATTNFGLTVGRCNSPLTQVTDVGVAVRVIDSSARRLHAIASWVGLVPSFILRTSRVYVLVLEAMHGRYRR